MALEFVEDYIEFLYGTLDKDGNRRTTILYNQSAIKLATYDKSPVSSMGAYCQKAFVDKLQQCLTDKQILLARKIIGKYRRQFSEQGIILPNDIDSMPARHNLRSIDRTKALHGDIDNKKFTLRFPYDPQKITALHEYVNNSAGNCSWDQQQKLWTFDLTEGNIKKVVDLFKNDDLQINDPLSGIVHDVMKASIDQLPTIALKDNSIVLHNCHPGVHEYLSSKNFKSNDIDNISKWVTYACCLGLNIDVSIRNYLLEKYGSQVTHIITEPRVILPSKNQVDGDWHVNLLQANRLLPSMTWVLYLNWWSEKTDWSGFQNITSVKSSKKSFNVIEPSLAELLTNNEVVIIMDSVIGPFALRNFIEQKAFKVIYISDIGPGT